MMGFQVHGWHTDDCPCSTCRCGTVAGTPGWTNVFDVPGAVTKGDTAQVAALADWLDTPTAADAIRDFHADGLTAEQLQALLPKLDAAVGKQAACVIGNWMGGAPPASLKGQIDDQKASWFTKNSLIGYVAAWAGKQYGGGYIPSIEDACPGGPSLESALDALHDTDPALFNEILGRGQSHRDQLAVSVARDVDQASAHVYQYPMKKLEQVLSGITSTLNLAGWLVQHAVPVALGAGALYLAWKAWRDGMFSKRTA